MSATIDERVVEMRFNNQQFEKNANESIKTLDKLNASLDLKGSTEGFDALQKSIKSVDLSTINGAMDAVTNKISMIGVIGDQVLRNLTNKVTDFGLHWVKSLSIDQISSGFEKYATKTESVQTIMNATGKDIDEVSKVLAKLNTYTDETSYKFTDMVSSIGKFTSAGVDLEVAENAMEGIANWAAKAGVGPEKAASAFYNMSQAIGSGALKLQDWKSIENLNMATKDVKEQFIEAGLAAGTLVKAYNGVVTANGRAKVSTDNFNESMSKGWINRDVILRTMEKYSDTTQEFGLNAFHAAQEAKTFKDAIDAVKDAVSTGWMNIFEQIFGNYEEARHLWTDVANELIEAFTAPTSALYDLMEGWHQGGGYDAFVESLSNAWTGLKSVVTEVSDIFKEMFPGVSVRNLVSYTEKIRDLTKAFRDAVTKDTIDDYFSEDRLELLEKHGIDISEVYENISAQNDKIEDNLKNLKDTFRGLFSILNLVKTVIKGIGKLTVPFLKLLGPISRLVSTIAGALGRLATKMVDTILNSKTLNTAFSYLQRTVNGVTRIIGLLVDDFTDFISNFKQLPAVKEFTNILHEMWQNMKNLAAPYIQKAKTAIEEFLDNLESVNTDDIYAFLNTLAGYLVDLTNTVIGVASAIGNYLWPKLVKFWNFIRPAFTWLWGQLSGVFNWIEEFVASEQFQTLKKEVGKVIDGLVAKVKKLGSELITFIQQGGLLGVFQWLKKSLTDIWNTIRGMKWSKILQDAFTAAEISGFLTTALAIYRASKLFKTANTFLSGLPDTLKSFSKGLGLKRFASSVLMLAGALYLLSQVPIGDIWELFGVLASLSATLVIFSLAYTTAINAMSMAGILNTKAMRSGALAMATMAASMLLLAMAAKKMSDIPGDKLDGIVGSLVAFMGVITAATFGLSFAGKGIRDLGIGMVAIAAALLLLILALDKVKGYLSEFQSHVNDQTLTKATIILAGVITSLILVSAALKKVSSAAWQTAAVILATGVAIYLVASAAKKLLEVNIDSLWPLIGVLGVLVAAMWALSKVAKTMPSDGGKKLLGLASSLAGLGVGVLAITFALEKLGKMDASVTRKGLRDLAVIMSLIALVMLAARKTTIGAGGFIGMALAIVTIIGVLKYLSKQNYSKFMAASTILGAILLKLGLSLRLGWRAIATAKFGGMMGIVLMIVAVAAALGLLAKFVDSGALLGASVALGGAMIAIGTAMRIASKAFKNINWSQILQMVIMVIVVAAAIGALATFSSPVGAIAAAAAIGLVLEALADSMARLRTGTLGANMGQMAKAVLIGIMALIPIAAALGILANQPWDGLLAAAGAISVVMPVLSACIAGLSKVNVHFSPGQIIGTFAMMAAILIAVGGSLWLLSKAFEKTDTSRLMDIAESVSLMMIALTGITAAIGAIGTFIAPQVALKGLADIGIVLGGIILIIGTIAGLDAAITALGGDAIAGINRVGDIFMAIGEAVGNLIGGIGLGISDALPGIGANISAFVDSIVPGMEKLSGIKIDESSMKGLEAFASAALKLTANDILDGLTSWITGGSSLTDFAADLAAMGPSLAKFDSSISDIDTAKIEDAAGAIETLADVASTLNKEGGLFQAVTGVPKDLGTFADELGQMVGENGGLSKFASAAPEIAAQKDNIASVAEVLQALVDVANAIEPTSNGLQIGDWSLVTSQAMNLKDFVAQLPSVGLNLKTFGAYIDSLPDNFNAQADKVATAIGSLVELANALDPTQVSIFGIYKEQTPELGLFLKRLTSVAPALDDFVAAFTDAKLDRMQRVGEVFTSFATTSQQMDAALDAKGISTFTSMLLTTASDLSQADEYWKAIDFTAMGEKIQQFAELSKVELDFSKWGEDSINSLLTSMQDKAASDTSNIVTAITNGISKELKGKWSSFVSTGQYLASGLRVGILSKLSELYGAGVALSDAAIRGAKARALIASPSKVMIKNGEYIGEGFVIGIGHWLEKANEAGKNLSESTIDSAMLALDYINRLVSSDMDTSMTIRPVLDFTDVETGIRRIDSLFAQRQAIVASIEADSVNNREDLDELLEVGWKILKEIQNGSDLYLDDKVLAGRINRRLGQT